MNAPPTWGYLARMARFKPALYLSHALLWGTMSASALLPGVIVRALLDGLTGHLQPAGGTAGSIALLAPIALLGLIAAGQACLWLVGGYVEILMRFTMSGLLRRNLLQAILRRPGALGLPFSIGESLSRFRDDAHQAEDNLDWTDEIAVQGVFAAVAFIVLLRIDARLTLIVFLPLLAVTLLARWGGVALRRVRAASSEATSRVTGAIGELLGAVQTLQAAGAEGRAVAHFQRLNERRRIAMLLDRTATQALDAVAANTASIGAGLIMLLAAGALLNGRLTVGDFVLFVAYLGITADFTAALGGFLAHIRQTGVAFGRMGALLGETPPSALVEPAPLHLKGPLPPAQPVRRADGLRLVEARGLTYRHPQSGRGIAAVDLALARGTLTVVTGRVGSGKTTLLRALLGLLPLEAGTIAWNGRPIDDPAAFFVPPQAAYTAQVPRLFSATLKENILLGLPDEPEALAAALHAAVMERDVGTLKAGLETRVGTRGIKLSGGQVQRAATARMLVRGAELLVIDDLSSALDIETEQQLWARLFTDRTPTCLAVSHRRAALRRADRIIVLKEGRVEAEGSLAELLANRAEMRAIWDEAP